MTTRLEDAIRIIREVATKECIGCGRGDPLRVGEDDLLFHADPDQRSCTGVPCVSSALREAVKVGVIEVP